jgi:DNA-binding CsgD family transcriptional regulator/ligand-binding sensor protein
LKIKELLQNVQEAYASLVNLPIIIIDSFNTSITSVSNINKIAELVFFENDKSIQKTFAEEWEFYIRLKNPAVIDSKFQGLKTIIAPVIVKEKFECLILAGPFIEKGKKQLVREQCRNDRENREQWIDAIEAAPEYSIIDIEDKLAHIAKMSNVCAYLIESEKQKIDRFNYLSLIKKTIDNHVAGFSHIDHFLGMFRHLDQHIDFVIYAKRQHEKGFTVDKIIGEVNHEAWLGTVYESATLFINQLLNEKKPLYFDDLSLELNLADFISKGIKPKSLLIYPILHNNEVAALIFVGSQEKKRFTDEVKEAGHLLARLIEFFFINQLYETLVDKHLMRISTLIEISKAMSMIDNINEILRIMTDLAADLVQSDISVTVLNDQGPKIIADNELISSKLINEYCNNLWKRYFIENEEKFSDSPKLYEANIGTVMEYPFYIDQHLQCVLAVLIKDAETIKEAEVYLSALITIVTVILQRLVQNSEHAFNNPTINNKLLSESLTSREMDVLRYLVQGYSNREIAEKLYISVHTVKNHITNIFQKLGVTDRSQVIAMVYQLNYAKPKL